MRGHLCYVVITLIIIHFGSQAHSDPKLAEQWEFAFNFAMQSQSKFQDLDNSLEDVEKKSCKAIELLMKR
jgi:hypothetical protein